MNSLLIRVKRRSILVQFLFISLASTLYLNILATYPSQAKDTVQMAELPANEANRIAWSSHAVYVTTSEKKYEDKFLAHLIVSAYRQAAITGTQIDQVELIKSCNTLKDKVKETLRDSSGNWIPDDEQAVREMRRFVVSIPPIAEYADLINMATDYLLERHYEGIKADHRVFSQVVLQNQIKTINDIPDSVWSELWRLGNGAFGGKDGNFLVDTVFASDLGNVSVRDSAAKIYANNGHFDQYHLIKDNLGENGKLKVDLKNIKDKVAQQQVELKNVVRDQVGEVTELAKEGKGTLDYLKKKAVLQTQIENQNFVFETSLNGMKSSVYLMSQLAGGLDQNAGRAISVVGNSAIKLADSVNKYKNSMAGISRLGSGAVKSLTGFGAVTLTADVVSVAMDIFGLFGNGPTPEQIILEQINELRKDIVKIAQGLHDRFDSVDESLNKIHKLLIIELEKLDAIAFDTHLAQREISSIQRQLLELESQLNRIESNISAKLRDGFGRDILAKERECLRADDYVRRYGMTYNTYTKCILALSQYAAKSSTDSVSMDRVGGDPGDYALAELLKGPLDSKIEMLAQIAAQRFGMPGMLQHGQLPNPLEWAFGAEAFLTLTQRRPQFAKLTQTSVYDEVIETGTRLTKALATIPNKEFLDSLLDNYKRTAQELVAMLNTEQTIYQNHPTTGTFGFPLWYGEKFPELGVRFPHKIQHCDPGLRNPHPALKTDLMQIPENLPKVVTEYWKGILALRNSGVELCYADVLFSNDCTNLTSGVTIVGTFENRQVFRRRFTTTAPYTGICISYPGILGLDSPKAQSLSLADVNHFLWLMYGIVLILHLRA